MKLYERVRTEEQALSMHNSLDSALKWCNDWQVLFNLSICKVLHVGKNNLKHQYSMDGLPLDHVTDEKDLGVRDTESFKSVNSVTLLLLKLTEFLELLKKLFHVGTVLCYQSCINP